MNKNAIILLIATLLMFSSLAIGLEASVSGNNNWSPASPQVLTGTTEIGNVYIYANGTVSNSSVVQQVGSSNTYDLLTNINGSLFDYRNASVVNGNGLALRATSSSGAFVSENTTGVTVENVVLGSGSQYGIQLLHVANAVVDHATTVNYTGTYLIDAYYSSNVTVENGNFSFSSTSSYGVYTNYVSSMNVSYNSFSGTSYRFVSYEYSGTFDAFGNSIMSTDSNSNGFYLEYSGSAIFTHNRVNDTEYAFTLEYTGAILSMYNTITNSSNTGIYTSSSTSLTSLHDTITFGASPYYLEFTGTTFINYGNFSNSSDASYFYYYSSVTIANSFYTTTSASYSVYFYEGGTVNLLNDYMNMSKTNSGEAVYTEEISGWVNLANDYVYTPSGYGLYLGYSPLFNVTNSYLDTSYGIYVTNSNSYPTFTSFATITHDTFLTQYGGKTVYMYDESNVNNVNFSNNTVISPSSDWGDSVLYAYAYYSFSNITFSGNTVVNNYYPLYLYSDSVYGNIVKAQHNTIVNSTYAIYLYQFLNSTVTSNTIINTTYYGIYIYADGPGAIVSNNLVENMPGFGSMVYAISVEGAYGGYNVVSNNTVLNPGGGEGFYIYESYGISVFSNMVSNAKYAFDAEDNYNLLVFGNTVSNAYYGIYSYYNGNSSFYSNTVNNANISFYSYEDWGIFVFGNTFYDMQANNSGLYLLQVEKTYYATFYHNNFINRTTNSTTHIYVYPDGFGPVFMNDPLPVGGNYYSNYTGTGTNGIGSTPVNFGYSVQDLYPLLKEWTSPTVTFLENGLPSGTSWTVALGELTQSGSGSGIVFQQTNGQYTTESYTVSNVPGYTASVSSGSVSLDGTSNVVTINFTPVTYAVTFTESGLANGTIWSVTLNGNTETTNTTSLGFNVANGTYAYSVTASGYSLTASSGNVTVNGSPRSLSVQFAHDYALTFDEKGLPTGDSWTVTIGGRSYNSTNASITVDLVPGTYNLTVSGPSGYFAVLSSSNVTMNSANQSLAVTFTTGKGTSGLVLYGMIGAGAFFGGAAAAFATMFVTGSGIFKKP